MQNYVIDGKTRSRDFALNLRRRSSAAHHLLPSRDEPFAAITQVSRPPPF